jgi:p-cumate 2,3-dioxygenase ferredoxin component
MMNADDCRSLSAQSASTGRPMLTETTNRTQVAVCAASEIVEGEIKGVVLPDGSRVALYGFEGKVYATSDTCTHGEASLSEEGLVCGRIVECTWHYGSFDFITGKVEASPCTVPLKIFPVEVKDGTVYVEY